MERQPSIQSSPAKVTMKERPETERPYEKCLRAGAESLTDGELLAVIIVVEHEAVLLWNLHFRF